MNTEELVRNAAAFLDEAVPGWWKRVKVDILDMSSTSKCVLGQLYGDYGVGCATLDVYDTPLHLAFWVLSPSEELKERQKIWKELIRARHDATHSVFGDGPAGADEPCYVGVCGNVLHE